MNVHRPRQALGCTALCVAACALLSAPVVAGPGDGERDYLRYCSRCHGHDGTGNGPLAGKLDPRPADLTRIAARRDGGFPVRELADIIDGRARVMEQGEREMPAWGRHFSAEFGDGVLSEELAKGKLLGIIDYLRSLQR